MRFVAFPATEYDEVLSGYQPGQHFEDHLCPRPQGTSLTMSLVLWNESGMIKVKTWKWKENVLNTW
jgi:hypothetical protein